MKVKLLVQVQVFTIIISTILFTHQPMVKPRLQTDTQYPVYRYGQVNANLYGAEASLTIHPVPFIHFENTFGYVHAHNSTLDRPLSFIPAGTLRNELRFEPKFKGTNDAYLSVGINSAFKQNRVDDIFETPTSGYTLLNAGIGATFNLGKQPVKLICFGE